MKVVLFCGGLGTRLRDIPGGLPKPMVNIGIRPILWHILRYYAHYGHREFILCLGYKADLIKQFFLSYDQHLSSNFTISGGTKTIHSEGSDIADLSITCVDTGLGSNIGERLMAVEKYVADDEYFLANYSDTLTDLPLPEMIKCFKDSGAIGSFLCVKPSQSFSVVSIGEGQRVERIQYVRDTELLINGGYFVFKRDIFRYIRAGEELVVEPFKRLIAEKKLLGYKYDRFWHCMDTFKEQQELNDMFERGTAPWEVWRDNKGQ
jgi:glucose-1-phosphate cytidylyltransferase